MQPKTFVPGVVGPDRVADTGLLFIGRGLDLLLAGGRVPTVAEARELADTLHFLGTVDDLECYAAALRDEATLPAGFELAPARSLFGAVDEATFQVAGRAISVAEWDRGHRFCGKCGARTDLERGERVRRCAQCRTPYYPRVSPAVIVLIEREGEVLLARGANFPGKWFSTLAGFVEPGESLEETVHREVMEEVGVALRDVRYFGSQPWPFGRSLMIGFNATYAGGEVKPDPAEIAEARWFRPDAMPQIPPKLSIANRLITSWLARMKSEGMRTP